MSKALEYLGAVRPDAASHYFKFLKESSRHLDDKTRFLIYVVTKVISGSESGFRQYVPHALQHGNTPDEIIDAILCAFPAAGLTKVLRAIDWLLDMGLPEFRPENLGRKAAWHEVSNISTIPEKSPVYLKVDGRHVFVYKETGAIHVYDSHCPHQMNDLTEMSVKDNNRLHCPRHGWVFDLATGACVEKGKRPLKSYKIKVEDGRLFVNW